MIWATGRAHFQKYQEFEAPRVRVRAYLNPMADAYAAADLALTRAGAMTTAELSAWGLPMILVPLPTAAADHQTSNALALERAGALVHREEHLGVVERGHRLRRHIVGVAGPDADDVDSTSHAGSMPSVFAAARKPQPAGPLDVLLLGSR